MKTKGTSLKNLRAYLKEKLGADFQKWLDALPEESKDIHTGIILNTKWYDLQDSIIKP